MVSKFCTPFGNLSINNQNLYTSSQVDVIVSSAIIVKMIGV
jgi:hypothetical protein